MRPAAALDAYLEECDHNKAWRIYLAEQLWTLNAAWREKYDYPHYADLIDRKSAEEQKASDAQEIEAVHRWLMGGDMK